MPHSRLTSASRCGRAAATSGSPARSQLFAATAGADILYDDEDSEARVAESRIRRWVSTPHTGQ